MSQKVKKKTAGEPGVKRWKKALFEQLIILLIYTVLLLTATYIAFLFGIEKKQCFYGSCGALSAASFISAFAAAKHAGKNGLIVGLLKTAFCNLLVMIAACICTGFHPDLRLLISAAILVLSAALGGIFGVNLNSRQKHTRRKGLHK